MMTYMKAKCHWVSKIKFTDSGKFGQLTLARDSWLLPSNLLWYCRPYEPKKLGFHLSPDGFHVWENKRSHNSITKSISIIFLVEWHAIFWMCKIWSSTFRGWKQLHHSFFYLVCNLDSDFPLMWSNYLSFLLGSFRLLIFTCIILPSCFWPLLGRHPPRTTHGHVVSLQYPCPIEAPP